MRRGRSMREHRERLLKRRITTTAVKRQVAQSKAVESKKQKIMRQRKKVASARARMFRREPKPITKADLIKTPAATPADLHDFKRYVDYQYSADRPAVVCHAIDSLGLGGAQVMMAEMVNGLNKYYSDHVKNTIVCINRKMFKFDTKMYKSYGVNPQHCPLSDLKSFCTDNKVDILVHHRVSIAKDIHKVIPPGTAYILINHTFHHMEKMTEFTHCDFYVSVCKFLYKRTKWMEHIHDSRKLVILNGVENDYIKDIPAAELAGSFKTGRCHRLVPSKFKIDSLRWLSKKVTRDIPGLTHYLMGISGKAKQEAEKSKAIEYLGQVTKRDKKMSVLKALDAYFYETFQHEGASMAILESLACGVPVLCKPMGGNNELVINGVNGFLVADRSEFHIRMKELASNKKLLDEMKDKTIRDYNSRLHVRHATCKYMQLFEWIVKRSTL